MASLIIENIPDALYEKLKQAAMSHSRSINSEAIFCLEQVLLPVGIASQDLKANAQRLRSQVNLDHLNADDIDSTKREGRA